MSLEEYLAVPYVLAVWSEQKPDGHWVRHAEYPELPGCSVEADATVDLVERAEAAREAYIRLRYEHGEYIPVPRPPLRA
ncbi:MAG: hypothetical protein K6U14_11750 [Firmicutes bacterium]|nr:hypothetical protein [Alicyclobacillaceae bacterium]MCL6498288.1 hypothetical protein [Bacillota bacterium]